MKYENAGIENLNLLEMFGEITKDEINIFRTSKVLDNKKFEFESFSQGFKQELIVTASLTDQQLSAFKKKYDQKGRLTGVHEFGYNLKVLYDLTGDERYNL